MNAQQRYAQQEAELIRSHGGIQGITLCNEKRGRDAFLKGGEFQPRQTNEWRYGYMDEHSKSQYKEAG